MAEAFALRLFDRLQRSIYFGLTHAQSRSPGVDIEEPVLLDGGPVFALPKHGRVSPELGVSRLLGSNILLKNVPGSGNEFEGFGIHVLIGFLQEILVAGNYGIQDLATVVTRTPL